METGMDDAEGPVLADFEGEWRLERSIEDMKEGRSLHFTGSASFMRDLDGMAYSETGRLVLPDGTRMPANRSYRWQEEGDGRVAVHFEDGSYFHSFDLCARSSADHWCKPDAYAVRYDFSGWPRWTSRWSVNGPRKEYVSESRYWRP